MENKQLLLMKIIALLLAGIMVIHLGVANANVDQHLMVTAMAIFNAILALLTKKDTPVSEDNDNA